MPKSRIIVTLGVLVALLPYLGFPGSWKKVLFTLFGISIVLISVWANVDKRLMLKAKVQKRQIHKRLQAQIQAEQLSKPQEEQV